MKLNIEVTQANIDESVRSTKCRCPIALAVMDEARANHGGKPQEGWASIDHDKGRLHISGNPHSHVAFSLPPKAQQFIRDRDNNTPVSPFSFAVTAVHP